MTGFERRVTIAFVVTAEAVLIEGIFYDGRTSRRSCAKEKPCRVTPLAAHTDRQQKRSCVSLSLLMGHASPWVWLKSGSDCADSWPSGRTRPFPPDDVRGDGNRKPPQHSLDRLDSLSFPAFVGLIFQAAL